MVIYWFFSGRPRFLAMLTKPDHYDWKSMGEIKLLEDDRSGLSADDLDPEELLKAKRWIAKAGWGFTLLIVVIWPVLSTPAGVFTKDYFAFWIFIAVIWALVASFIIIVLPIWESKDQILAVFDGIFHTNLCEYYNPETSKQHKCPVPLTVRGTQALVSFAPLAFKLFYAARQNAVLRRSPFPPP